jgi:hypothetical protein
MIKLFLMGIVVIVASIGLGLGIQHVMALGDFNCYSCSLGGEHHDHSDNGPGSGNECNDSGCDGDDN